MDREHENITRGKAVKDDALRNGSVKPMLAVLFAAAFVAAFNENIVNVGLVDIMDEFGIGSPVAQWMVTGYMIVTTIVVSIVAWLQKRFSLRTLVLAAGILLVAGSLADIAAPTYPLLLAARLVQAVGTGIFVPVMMTTVLTCAPRAKLGSYLAIGSACITLGPALGPVASGIMVTLFGWRSMFILPAVCMALTMLAAVVLVHPIAEPVHEKLDVASVALSAIGLTLLVYGLLVITSNTPLALGSIAAGLVGVALFAWRQGSIPNPVLDVSPLRQGRFLLACLLVIVCMMTTFSLSVLLPLYFEQAAGASAMLAGILLLAPILVNAATALAAGRIFDKHGEVPLLPAGYGLMALGLLLIFLTAGSIRVASVVAAASVAYAAVGLVMSPTQTSGLSKLSREQHASGVSLMNTFIQLAASIGPSLFVGILSSTASQASALGTASSIASAQGLASAIAVAACIALAGLLASLAYVRMGAKATRPASGRLGHSRTRPAVKKAPDSPLGGAAGASTGASAAAGDAHLAKAASSEMGLSPRAALPHPSGTTPVKALMKTDVFTISDTDLVADALKLLVEKRISGAPVVNEQGDLVAFVSDGDIMRHLADQAPAFKSVWSFIAEQGNEDFDRTLNQVMQLPVVQAATPNVITIEADSSMGEACRVLAEKHLKKAPVVEDGRMVGIINRSNISRWAIGTYLEGANTA